MILAHDVAGDGPALTLLHSSVCDRRMWDAQWPALLAAGYQVIRADLPGFGQTPVPHEPYRPAAEVLNLLDTLGIERTALVGASYGGRLALEIAASWPDRVTALALLCPGMPDHQPSAELSAWDARETALLEAGDVAGAVELNVSTWLGPEADEATRERVRQMQRHAFEVQLAAPDVPTIKTEVDLSRIRATCLVLSGRHDMTDFRRIAAGLPELLPDARHVELPWAGHLPNLERPAEIATLLTDSLAETLAAR